eukprot:gene1471-860_t
MLEVSLAYPLPPPMCGSAPSLQERKVSLPSQRLRLLHLPIHFHWNPTGFPTLREVPSQLSSARHLFTRRCWSSDSPRTRFPAYLKQLMAR